MPLSLNESIDRFRENEARVDLFVNDETGYTSSAGEPVESLPAFLERVEQEIETTTGTVAENLTASQAARAGAEAARDAAALNGRVYATTAAGIAATTSGQYFSVPSAVSTEFLTLYKNNAGTAEAIQTYPSVNLVQQVLSYFMTATFENAVEVRDPRRVFSVAITKLGELLAKRALVHNLRIGELLVDADSDLTQVGDNLVLIQDAAGKVVFSLKKDGRIAMKPLLDLESSVNDLQAQVDALADLAPLDEDLAALTRRAWSALAFATEVNGSVNVLGDSISVGVGASNQTTTSWWGLMKSAILGANGENLGGSTAVPHLTFYNSAVSGVTSSYFNNTSRLSAITTQGGVGLYIVALGTNNIYNSGAHTLPSVYESDLNAIVDYIQAASSANRVMIVVPPVANEATWAPYQHHSKYAAAARRVARAKGCLLCDDCGVEMVTSGRYADGVHPNDAGHSALFLNRLKAIATI